MASLTNKTAAFLLCSVALLGIWALPRFPLHNQPAGQHVDRTLPISTISPVLGASSVILAPIQGATRASIAQGWGGITLSEVVGSNVVPRLSKSGYNTIRVSFGTASGFPCLDGDLGSWDPTLFIQVLQRAEAYNMTVVLDYHGFDNATDRAFQPCWLSFWRGVLSTNWGYSNIVWEPINEPAGSASMLSSAYQAWITQARNLGDRHWIAVENTISNNGCNFDPASLVNCYPVITDPLNETFLSIHPYFFNDIWLRNGYGNCSPSATNTWGNKTAECVADIYNQGMLQASTKYHLPILDTEGGAIYYSCNNVCANPPDAVVTDDPDASYSNTTLHFIQYLTDQMQSENMGWLWWEAGEGSCCGALDTWGNLLRFQPMVPPSHDRPLTLQAPSGLSVVAGFILSFQVNASDPDTPPQNLTLSCIDCPVGASFPGVTGPSPVRGGFTWTPSVSQAGQSYNITFTASDGVQNSNATTDVTVRPPNTPGGSSPFPPPFVWLAVGGGAGLAAVSAVVLYRRRNLSS